MVNTEGGFGADNIEGVFSTKGKAKAFLEMSGNLFKGFETSIREEEVL